MDITLIGRNVGITDRFREYALEKSDRVTHLAERALSLEIRLCRHHETNGASKGDDRVELTLISPGPIVRAEAGGVDKYAAYDAALAKLLEQIRRAKDRRKVHRGHGNRLTSLREAASSEFASLDVRPADGDAMRWASTGPQQLSTEPDDDDTPTEHDAYSPIEIRRKVFEATPMTVDDALYRMELVGHDFYLYCDAETNRPSVVYRRKGWSYGVLELDVQESGEGAARPEEERETVSTT
jgi:ribosomal subunit interface protein